MKEYRPADSVLSRIATGQAAKPPGIRATRQRLDECRHGLDRLTEVPGEFIAIRTAPPTEPLDAVERDSHICTQNTSLQQ